jgi:hypothetical protein
VGRSYKESHDCFFLISKNSLKSAEGRNPSTQEVYKRAAKQRKEMNKKVKNQRTAYYPSYAPTPNAIYKLLFTVNNGIRHSI